MSVYLVTYDLNKESTRPPLLDDLKEKYPSWAKLSESSYAIETLQTPDQIYNNLKHHLDGNDHIAIITLKKPFQCWLPKRVVEWLQDKLTY